MTQRILSLLILGAILIGATIVVSSNRRTSTESQLYSETTYVRAQNSRILGEREALADYERKVSGMRQDAAFRRKFGLPDPVDVRLVK
jgi:hypothetical protein